MRHPNRNKPGKEARRKRVLAYWQKRLDTLDKASGKALPVGFLGRSYLDAQGNELPDQKKRYRDMVKNEILRLEYNLGLKQKPAPAPKLTPEQVAAIQGDHIGAPDPALKRA